MTTITAPDTSAFVVLGASLTGDVVVPESPEIDAARRVWNGEVDRHPVPIVRCWWVADVMAAAACS